MNDRQRKIFIDVVELGSFSKAAREGYVTPQSVSQQIVRLEEELGVTLLERTPTGVVPTPAGKVFYQGCVEAESAYNELLERCFDAAQAHRDQVVLRVAQAPDYTLALIERFLPRYLKSHPEHSVAYVDPGRTSPLESLRNDECDIIEIINPGEEGVAFEPLFLSHRCCAVFPDSPLARKEVVEPEDLVGLTSYVFNTSWASDLQGYLNERLGEYELHELPCGFDAVGKSIRDIEHMVLIIPEHLCSRSNMLLPVPLNVPVATEYGLAYLPSKAGLLADFLNMAREEFAQY